MLYTNQTLTNCNLNIFLVIEHIERKENESGELYSDFCNYYFPFI